MTTLGADSMPNGLSPARPARTAKGHSGSAGSTDATSAAKSGAYENARCRWPVRPDGLFEVHLGGTLQSEREPGLGDLNVARLRL